MRRAIIAAAIICLSATSAAAQTFRAQFEDLAACALPRIARDLPDFDVRTIPLLGVDQIVVTGRPAGATFLGNPPSWTARFEATNTGSRATNVSVLPGADSRIAGAVLSAARSCAGR